MVYNQANSDDDNNNNNNNKKKAGVQPELRGDQDGPLVVVHFFLTPWGWAQPTPMGLKKVLQL